MSSTNRNRSWPLWITATLILLPVLYAGSFRVSSELCYRRHFGNEELLFTCYGPAAFWCDRHIPQSIQWALEWTAGGEVQWDIFILRYVLSRNPKGMEPLCGNARWGRS